MVDVVATLPSTRSKHAGNLCGHSKPHAIIDRDEKMICSSSHQTAYRAENSGKYISRPCDVLRARGHPRVGRNKHRYRTVETSLLLEVKGIEVVALNVKRLALRLS